MSRLFLLLFIVSALVSCKSEDEILFYKYLEEVSPTRDFSDNAIIHVVNLQGCTNCIDYQLKILTELSAPTYHLILVGQAQNERQKSYIETILLPIAYDKRGIIKNYFFDFTNAIILSKATSQIIKIENEEDFHNFIHPFIAK
jgi:hypothetical protein